MEAIILAGGLGTRLRPALKNIPKPMALINGKPFLHFLVKKLALAGIKKIILSVGYRYEMVTNYFKDKYLGTEISYCIEDKKLGTGGAIKKAIGFTTGAYSFVVNGDTYFDADFIKIINFQKDKNADIVIALTKKEKTDRYGRVEMGSNKKIIRFIEKGYFDEGFINGGLYLMNKNIFRKVEIYNEIFSIENDFFEKYTKRLSMFGYCSNGYFIDIGTPEDYRKAANFLKDE